MFNIKTHRSSKGTNYRNRLNFHKQSTEEHEPAASTPQAGGSHANARNRLRKHTNIIQAKLRVNNSSDPREKEADRAANQISSGQKASARNISLSSTSPDSAILPSPETETEINAARREGGRPLGRSVRNRLENGFQEDLGDVRVHTDERAAKTARSIKARAFTTGNHIFFDSGEYSPNTRAGKNLLAHEVTHTLQQKGGAGGEISRKDQEKSRYVIRTKMNYFKIGWVDGLDSVGELREIWRQHYKHKILKKVKDWGLAYKVFVRLTLQLNLAEKGVNIRTLLKSPGQKFLPAGYKLSSEYKVALAIKKALNPPEKPLKKPMEYLRLGLREGTIRIPIASGANRFKVLHVQGDVVLLQRGKGGKRTVEHLKQGTSFTLDSSTVIFTLTKSSSFGIKATKNRGIFNGSGNREYSL